MNNSLGEQAIPVQSEAWLALLLSQNGLCVHKVDRDHT